MILDTMFNKIITGFFWDSYDNLGRIIIANILWFFCNLPGFLITFGLLQTPITIFWILLLIPLALFSVTTIGLYHFTSLLVDQKDIGVREFFIGMKKYGMQGTFYFLLFVLCIVVLVINIQFYIQLQSGLRWMGAVLAGLAFWIILFLLFIFQYFIPLYIRQNPPFKKLILRSLLLVLDNMGITLLVSLSSLGLLILTVLTGVGPILFTMSIFTLFGNNALFELLAKYEEIAQTKETLKPGEKPTSWHQILTKEKPKWRHEGRGWKDILRPWDV